MVKLSFRVSFMSIYDRILSRQFKNKLYWSDDMNTEPGGATCPLLYPIDPTSQSTCQLFLLKHCGLSFFEPATFSPISEHLYLMFLQSWTALLHSVIPALFELKLIWSFFYTHFRGTHVTIPVISYHAIFFLSPLKWSLVYHDYINC